MKWQRLIFLVALLGVPRHLRASVHGDLLEQHGGVREAIAIALHFQAEPYRASIDRRVALMLMLAGCGILWIVPMAAQSLLAQATVFDDAFSRAALQLWGAPAVWAAVACGLMVGRASLLPPHADPARLHIVLVLAPAAALASAGALQAVLSAATMSAAAWLGHTNRQASTDCSERT
jgi:hypothetical protein